jgi:ribosomal protein S18 acetylase RimI-like enzyme
LSEASAGATTIRVASAADAEAIGHVHRESWRTTYTGILPLDVIEQHAGRQSGAMWRSRLTGRPEVECVHVAERDGRTVGFASCGQARHLLEGLEAEIFALYVLQDHQRRGVGRQLVRASARHFVRHGLFGFYLWVLKANRARLFYESMGGAEIGEKSERLGQHSFSEVAYGWHDLTPLVTVG